MERIHSRSLTAGLGDVRGYVARRLESHEGGRARALSDVHSNGNHTPLMFVCCMDDEHALADVLAASLQLDPSSINTVSIVCPWSPV